MKHIVLNETTISVLPHDARGISRGSHSSPLPAGQVERPAMQSGYPASAQIARPMRQTVRRWYLKGGKRAFDILFLIATLPVSVPIVLFCALALWFEGGQPFYRQDRLGRHGRIFSIFKLRTMVPDAEARLAEYLEQNPAMRHEWETTQKLKRDPRVTPLGAFLRASSMDEMPQLWNVLKGEMSLVGPRPMMPDQLTIYGDSRPYFTISPGLTGIWQVSDRNETGFSSRAEADAAYVATVSLWGDIRLLYRTVGVVLQRTGY